MSTPNRECSATNARKPKALCKKALSMGQKAFLPKEYDVFAGLA